MFKRARWTTFGMVVGAGTSIWAQHKVRQTVERYLPEQVGTGVAGVTGRTRQLGADVRAAVAEGRQAMHEREAELRAHVESPRPRRRPAIEATTADLPVAAREAHGRHERAATWRRR
ncbi:MAG: hypothetical protein ACRDXE_02770 [Acidimicrobiales bacterium]